MNKARWMKSLTSPDFWRAYAPLPPEARASARKAYRLWQQNPGHGSLRFQKVRKVLAGLFRNWAIVRQSIAVPDGYLWFWIGDHDKYERLLKSA